MTVKEHYDNHLAGIYSWMLGDEKIKISEQQEYFKSNNVKPVSKGYALDLGCGSGIQSIALARSGFAVTAVDFSQHLLSELIENSAGLNIKTIEADFTDFSPVPEISYDVITCMGDTIIHLASVSDIEKIFRKSFDLLISGGKLIISFRDLSMELEGVSRFLPVKSDENRILTCFLEYFRDFVMVHDILHEKENGQWIQKISSYKKIRISEKEMLVILERSGFNIKSSEVINRMVYIIAEKIQSHNNK